MLIMIAAPGALTAKQNTAQMEVSGKIIGGFRILPIAHNQKNMALTVYRGDYVKFQFDPGLGPQTLTIPELSINQLLEPDLQKAAYFKMKKVGRLAFTLGKSQGVILVVPYSQANYHELTSPQAKTFIDQSRPLILDVRTPREYQKGHLPNSLLIPLQSLQERWKEIAAYREEDVLIYCATGNRSTVAAKILIDNGFKRIYNMRRGIVDWHGHKYPIVR